MPQAVRYCSAQEVLNVSFMGCRGKGWFASVQCECTINVTESFNWSCIESGIESSAVESK